MRNLCFIINHCLSYRHAPNSESQGSQKITSSPVVRWRGIEVHSGRNYDFSDRN